jgi:hypothetical protein
MKIVVKIMLLCSIILGIQNTHGNYYRRNGRRRSSASRILGPAVAGTALGGIFGGKKGAGIGLGAGLAAGLLSDAVSQNRDRSEYDYEYDY